MFEFLRNGAMNARNFFAPAADKLKRNQYGGSAGGPIVNQWDRLHAAGLVRPAKAKPQFVETWQHFLLQTVDKHKRGCFDLRREGCAGVMAGASPGYGSSYEPSRLIQMFLYLTICPWSCKLSGSAGPCGVYFATLRCTAAPRISWR